MSRCLVTGAAGFIGSHLCETLLARGDDVLGVDCFTDYYDPARKRANLENAFESGLDLHRRDLTRAELDDILEGVDVVFHLAAQPGVRPSWGEDFDLYAQHNIVGTQRLLEAALHAGVARFAFASSSSVYGTVERRAACESDRPGPVSPYGLTKTACEELVGVYRRVHGLSAVSLRYFTVYGPRQRPEMAFASFIDSVLSGRPLRVFGDGHQSRDFTYVSDAVSATVSAAEVGAEPVYNVSGGSCATVREAISQIEHAVGRRASVRYAPTARGDAHRTDGDLTLARRDLGYRPRVTLAEGLARQVEAARLDASSFSRAVG